MRGRSSACCESGLLGASCGRIPVCCATCLADITLFGSKVCDSIALYVLIDSALVDCEDVPSYDDWDA